MVLLTSLKNYLLLLLDMCYAVLRQRMCFQYNIQLLDKLHFHMNTNYLKATILALLITLTSCNKDDEPTIIPNTTLEVKTASNIPAPQTGGQGQPVGGVFTKFSFSENAVVTNENWDIAFRGTTILVNGGPTIGISDEPNRTGNAAASIVTGLFNNITTVPESTTFNQDGTSTYAIPTGSNNGWYSYNSATNIITPILGKVFVFKTYNGKYAKVEFLSYYQNNPANPDANSVSRYYTFKYVYQPNGYNL